MKLFYITAFFFCFFICFLIYGRILDLSPDLVPYFAGAAGWLIVVIERRNVMKDLISQLKNKN
jgi:hypothetical protein